MKTFYKNRKSGVEYDSQLEEIAFEAIYEQAIKNPENCFFALQRMVDKTGQIKPKYMPKDYDPKKHTIFIIDDSKITQKKC